MKTVYYLSVDMFTGEPKIGKRKPKSTVGTAVFELELNVPDSWAKPVGKIELNLPEPPDNIVEVYEMRDALGLGDE